VPGRGSVFVGLFVFVPLSGAFFTAVFWLLFVLLAEFDHLQVLGILAVLGDESTALLLRRLLGHLAVYEATREVRPDPVLDHVSPTQPEPAEAPLLLVSPGELRLLTYRADAGGVVETGHGDRPLRRRAR
jgi:hypothetical protein